MWGFLFLGIFINMRIIITEEQFSRFNRGNPALQNGIIKFMNSYIKNGKRTIKSKSRNYGNIMEEWCIGGKNEITSFYYFDEGKIYNGTLTISEDLVETITKLFSVRQTYVLHVIEEWYEDTMIPELEKLTGESALFIDGIRITDKTYDCVPEPTKPEGITDEEMIDFIDKNTAYKRQDIIDKIESGERGLEEFYLDIVDIVNRNKIFGF